MRGGGATRPLAVRTAVVAAALAGMGALAPSALGVAPRPVTPADNAVVTTVRPTFTWTAGQAFGIRRYEVLVQVGSAAPVEILETPAGTLSGTPSADLPDDTNVRWYVRLVNAFGGTESTPNSARADITISATPAVTTITAGPGGPTNVARPVFSWTGQRSQARWEVLDARGASVQDGTAGGSAQVVVNALKDGAYTFRVAQRTGNDLGPYATRAFSVDTAVPPALTLAASDRAPSATPTFTWSGVEPGAVSTWRVVGVGSAVVRGPVDTLTPSAALDGLPAGAYVMEVSQRDAAGNVSPVTSSPFAVLPADPPAKTSPRLPSLNPSRLAPRRGARVTSRRPTLRWKQAPGGARLYNVQIWRVGAKSTKLIKVRSVFPRARRYRIPLRARLKPGQCYVWRVWPFKGSKFTAKPLGISNFCVAKPARPRGRS